LKLSARNQLSGTDESVNEGVVIANVEFDVNGQHLVASITVSHGRCPSVRGVRSTPMVVRPSSAAVFSSRSWWRSRTHQPNMSRISSE
jgi:hypothetical protein